MSRRPWTQAVEWLRRPAGCPLLAAAFRPLAAGLLAVCVAVTVFLGARFAHQGRPGGLDRAIDFRVRGDLGGHPGLLDLVAGIGDPIPVTVLTVALVVACLATRRCHGAVLVAVAVPVAGALTELVLKPLIGRTMKGALSFPSGHSTGMFAVAGACAVLLVGPCRPPMPAAARVLLALAAYLVAAAVAVALIGLGAHYFTDTVAGAAVGTAIVLVTAFILDWLGPPGQLQSPVRHPAPARAGHKLPAGAARAVADARGALHAHCHDIGRDLREITLSSHVWLTSGSDQDLGHAAEEVAALAAEGLDLAIIYLLPPIGPAVLTPLAEALAVLR